MLSLHKIAPSTNRQPLLSPINFDLVLDCTEEIDNIEFTVLYIGSPDTEKFDQTICNTEIGPIPKGRVGFTLETDIIKILDINNLFGVTSIVIIGKFRNLEFLRVGYFVRIEYPGINVNELINEEKYEESEETESIDDECSDDEVDSENDDIVEDDDNECEDEQFDDAQDYEDDSESRNKKLTNDTISNEETNIKNAELHNVEEKKNLKNDTVLNEEKNTKNTELLNVEEKNNTENLKSEILDEEQKNTEKKCIEELNTQINDSKIHDPNFDNKEFDIYNEEIDMEAGNCTLNLLLDSTLKAIQETEKFFPENRENEEDRFATDEKAELKSMLEVLDDQKNEIYKIKDYELKASEITIEFCEPPLTTFYNINWTGEEERIEEEIIDGEEEEILENELEELEEECEEEFLAEEEEIFENEMETLKEGIIADEEEILNENEQTTDGDVEDDTIENHEEKSKKKIKKAKDGNVIKRRKID